MNPLIFHLKDKYYWMISNGEKTTEYREYKPYWISRIKDQTEIIFCPGYCRSNEWDIKATVENISIVDFDDLPEYAKIEFYGSDYDKFFAIDFIVRK